MAFALQDDGWILRNDIIWAKPNAMPESMTDRLSSRHEHLFMLTKSARYWFDLDAIRGEEHEHAIAGQKGARRWLARRPESRRARVRQAEPEREHRWQESR